MNIMDRRYRDLTVGIAYGRMLERTGEEPDMERLYEIYDRSQKDGGGGGVINTVILFVFLLIFLIVFSLVSWMFIIPLILAAFFFVRYIGKMQNMS